MKQNEKRGMKIWVALIVAAAFVWITAGSREAYAGVVAVVFHDEKDNGIELTVDGRDQIGYEDFYLAGAGSWSYQSMQVEGKAKKYLKVVRDKNGKDCIRSIKVAAKDYRKIPKTAKITITYLNGRKKTIQIALKAPAPKKNAVRISRTSYAYGGKEYFYYTVAWDEIPYADKVVVEAMGFGSLKYDQISKVEKALNGAFQRRMNTTGGKFTISMPKDKFESKDGKLSFYVTAYYGKGKKAVASEDLEIIR